MVVVFMLMVRIYSAFLKTGLKVFSLPNCNQTHAVSPKGKKPERATMGEKFHPVLDALEDWGKAYISYMEQESK